MDFGSGSLRRDWSVLLGMGQGRMRGRGTVGMTFELTLKEEKRYSELKIGKDNLPKGIL